MTLYWIIDYLLHPFHSEYNMWNSGGTWLVQDNSILKFTNLKVKKSVPCCFMQKNSKTCCLTLDLFLQKWYFSSRFHSPPSSSHPPFPLPNKPSSSSSSHSATFYLCCTWEIRGGWERRWMKQGVETERERGKEESKIGKNALWLDLKVCGISFSERGELHLLQIL